MNNTKLTNILKESGLSRLWKHMEMHDTGIISAFRYARNCGIGLEYTKNENLKRNASLLSKLFVKNYNVVPVKGSYIENYNTDSAKEISENSFFVVDIKDNGNLLSDLKFFGEEFEQDSILFIPKGGLNATLYGTNKCTNSYPGYNKTKFYNKRFLGNEGEFFARVSGRPFKYSYVELKELVEYSFPRGFFGKWPCSTVAKMKWEDIELRDVDIY